MNHSSTNESVSSKNGHLYVNSLILNDAMIIYLKALKNSFSFVNNISYANHFLYFSIIKNGVALKVENNDHNYNYINWANNCFRYNLTQIYEETAIILFLDRLINNLNIISSNNGNKKQKKDKNKESIKKWETDNFPKNYGNGKKKSNYVQDNNIKNRSKINFKKNSDLNSMTKMNFSIFPNKKIGKFDIPTRVKKILKFKITHYKHRFNIPLVRKFLGRSKIAQTKARYRGRFIKQTKRIFGVISKN